MIPPRIASSFSQTVYRRTGTGGRTDAGGARAAKAGRRAPRQSPPKPEPARSLAWFRRDAPPVHFARMAALTRLRPRSSVIDRPTG